MKVAHLLKLSEPSKKASGQKDDVKLRRVSFIWEIQACPSCPFWERREGQCLYRELEGKWAFKYLITSLNVNFNFVANSSYQDFSKSHVRRSSNGLCKLGICRNKSLLTSLRLSGQLWGHTHRVLRRNEERLPRWSLVDM